MEKLEGMKQAGTFGISPGREIYGELSLAGRKSRVFSIRARKTGSGIRRYRVTGKLAVVDASPRRGGLFVTASARLFQPGLDHSP
jgi:hypothetical protein